MTRAFTHGFSRVQRVYTAGGGEGTSGVEHTCEIRYSLNILLSTIALIFMLMLVGATRHSLPGLMPATHTYEYFIDVLGKFRLSDRTRRLAHATRVEKKSHFVDATVRLQTRSARKKVVFTCNCRPRAP